MSWLSERTRQLRATVDYMLGSWQGRDRIDPERIGAFGNVSVPMQLWSADQDTNAPYATNTGPVREGLGPRAEFHSVAGAGHFSFLAPCGLLRPPGLCPDPGQFDRKAFHAEMNDSVVAFFDSTLNGDAT